MQLHREWLDKNKESNSEYMKNWRANNKHVMERHNLKRLGITPEDKQKLIIIQHFKCACCSRDLGDVTKNIHTDHDHATGEIRGIICHKCNTTLGLLGDSLSAVEESCTMYKEYLKR